MKRNIYFFYILTSFLFFLSVNKVFADMPALNPGPYSPSSPKVSSTPSIFIVGGIAVTVSLVALFILLRRRG
jgi:hypothetical protein